MRALRAQMNPHFIFNCLNSINRYIVKADPETASLYLTKFSRLIRIILENSKASRVLLENELQAISLYMDMELIRFDHKFTYEITVDSSVNPAELELPPMILQPYIENAIWHGLLHQNIFGKITILIAKEKEFLRCVIEDNGIGRVRSRSLKVKSKSKKSLGMQITSERLSLLTENNSSRSSVEIVDLYTKGGDAAGTRVIIKIPVKQTEPFQTNEVHV
jgi:LytS/YehU family sensor histidine kinase